MRLSQTQLPIQAFPIHAELNPYPTNSKTCGKYDFLKLDLPDRSFEFASAQRTFFIKFLLKIRPIYKKQISREL